MLKPKGTTSQNEPDNESGEKQLSDRKQQILNAALAEFTRNGYEGGRLKVIADQVGVTKAMIHYYFDTKENLFRTAFDHACGQVLQGLFETLEGEEDLFVKLEQFIETTNERSHSYPTHVAFIITSLNRDPDLTRPMLQSHLDFDRTALDSQLEEAASAYEIASVQAEQLMINILSLCMLPYAAPAFLSEAIGTEPRELESLLARRKGVATDVIFNWLTS